MWNARINVTGEFNNSGNTAVLENLNPVAGNPSIRGMLLAVIYESESGEGPECKIFVNEGFDLLYGGSDKCTTPEEATAYAPFTGAIEDAGNRSARLITVAPGASDEGELIFNGHEWSDVWKFAGDSQIGVNECDVTSYLNTTNVAAFQSSGDYMEASNAILVVESKVPGIMKEFELLLVKGWNLISIPLEVANTSINAVFPDATDGDVIYNYDVDEGWVIATYYSGYGWYGDLKTIVPDKGYWYLANSAYNATIKGTESGLRSVSLSKGWNLIGYTNLHEANIGIIENATDGDVIYNYDVDEGWVIATYYSGYGWYGDLKTIVPGKGYWYLAKKPFTWGY